MLETAVVRSALHQGSVADDPRRHPHHPTPDPATGALAIDPEIELKARKFNLAISFHYNTGSDTNDEYGRRRSASVHGHALSATGGQIVTIVRGDGSEAWFQRMGTSGGVTTFAAATNQPIASSLTYDETNFFEHFPDGMKLIYHVQVGGTPVKHEIVGVEDPMGNRHTYSYVSGTSLLETIETPGGRKVTFAYASGSPTSLLSSIEDWGGRRWTFQYDANRELTTFTTPGGCTTKYAYTLASGGATMVHTIEDPRGYRTTYAYDTSNRVVSMAAGTAIWTWSYDAHNRTTTMASPSGAVTTYQYDADGVRHEVA